MNKRTLTSWLLSCALLIGVIGSGLAQKGTGSSPISTLRNGLIGYWDFDETSGNRAAAFQAGSLTMTDNNTVGNAAGKLGNAASFVRANSEDFSIADSALVSMGAGSNTQFAFTAWVLYNSAVNTTTFHQLTGKNGAGPSRVRHYRVRCGGWRSDADRSEPHGRLSDCHAVIF